MAHRTSATERNKFNLLFKKQKLVAGAIKIMLSANGKKKFTLIGLARQLGTNETTLKHTFKEVTNMTIYGYFQQCRMHKAIEMMKRGYSIGYISESIGYSSMSHFSYAFKRMFGMPPSAYTGQVLGLLSFQDYKRIPCNHILSNHPRTVLHIK